jgi:putative ABC transport system substrate-binding protein
MRRREFITLLGGAATTWPLLVNAQPSQRPRLVGLVTIFTRSEMRPIADAFRSRLKELGWDDGGRVTVDVRTAGGDYKLLESDTSELVSAGADVIVAMGSPVVAAVNRHTSAVPVVFTLVADPVGQHLIDNLAHPGGNLTGLTNFEFSIGGKWLELLRQFDPKISSVTLITNPVNQNTAPFVQAITAAGGTMGVTVRAEAVTGAADIERAIAAAGQSPDGSLIIFPDGLPVVHRDLIVSMAARYRLPALYPFRVFAVNGGLASYGVDFTELFRQAANFTDKILRGAKPAELPVQAPNKFELVINMKTAKALGLSVSNSLLVTADEVIE